MKIGLKITAMAMLPIILTAVVVLGVALYQKSVLSNFFAEEIDRQAQSEAQKIVQSVYLMCRAVQESAQQAVNANLRVAADILKHSGPVSCSRQTVTWEATNQFSQEKSLISLPQLLVGGKWLGQNRDLSRTTPVVDKTKELVDGTATIFQRMNQAGDMLRVATNVTNLDGSRAIGTFIPATEPNGTPNQVVQTLLSGQIFRGRAFVVNAWYITAYQPIWNADQTEVIGALYVGVEQEKLESLRKGIMDIQVGRTGYVWVLGGHGKQLGQYIISKDGARDGEAVIDSKDRAGNYFMRRMIDKAIALSPPGEGADIPVVFDCYLWRNPGEPEDRCKSVAITYYAPWDWVIGAAYYKSDFAPLQQRTTEALNNMALWVSFAALLMVLFAPPIGRLIVKVIRLRIDSILKSVSDVLIITDTQDRIFLLSQSAEKLFGVNLRKVESQPLCSIIEDVTLRSKIVEVLKQRRTGVQIDFNWSGPKPGQQRIMRGRTSTIQTRSGNLVGMILSIHDVTGEREIERLKNELLSTTVHELNTPLTTIIGYSELMLDNPDQPVAEHREAISYINQRAWALSRIVHDLLDVSRIEAGKEIPVLCKKQDIIKIVHQVLHHAQNLTNNHTFEMSLPKGPVLLSIDQGKIEQVLENILNNAIKYSPEGASISVTGTIEETNFHLAVTDTGIGMTPEQLSRVFDKFYRADSSNTALEGTGLGMTVVKNIIDAHSGRIWIESSFGKGATVHILLPLAATESEADSSSSARQNHS